MSRQTINMAAYADVGTNADYSLTYISKMPKELLIGTILKTRENKA